MEETYPCRACGAATVGNGRSTCKVCNRFAARVRRAVGSQLRAMHPTDADRLVKLVTADLYSEIEWGDGQ